MSVSGVGTTGSSVSASSSYQTGATKTLSAQDQAQLDALKKRDTEVKTHEKAHQSAGGQFAGAPSYTYQKGPDGQQYAIGGEVSIDDSPVRNDPTATAAKMRIVQRAALAPAQPSAQDLHVAAEASAALAQAQVAQAQTQAATGTAKTGAAQAQTNFAAQSIGATQTGTAQTGTAQTGTGATGSATAASATTSVAATTATAAAAQDGGASGLRGLLARGLAAYASAANLGAVNTQTPALAISA